MAVDHVDCGATIGPRQIRLHNQAVVQAAYSSNRWRIMPHIHAPMADEAQRGSCAGSLLVKPCVRVRRRGVGCIRALVAPEVDFGIAGGGFGRGDLVIAGRVEAGWIAGIILAGRPFSLRPEAFH